jgi:hypothetical protein
MHSPTSEGNILVLYNLFSIDDDSGLKKLGHSLR